MRQRPRNGRLGDVLKVCGARFIISLAPRFSEVTKNQPRMLSAVLTASQKTVETVVGPSIWLVDTSLKRGANEIGWSVVTISHVNSLDGKHHAHRFGPAIEFRRNKGGILPERFLKICQHPAITRRLHNVRQRR